MISAHSHRREARSVGRSVGLSVLRSLILAGVLLGSTAWSAQLPIVLVGSSRIWKSVEMHKPAAPQVAFAALFARGNSQERFVILRSSRPPEEVDTLDEFAAVMREAFSQDSAASMVEKRASRMGFEGRELEFQLANPDGTFDCELFAFINEGRCWAVLHAKPIAESSAEFGSFALFNKRPTPPRGVAVMEPLQIVDNAISDFAIGFKIGIKPGTNLVARMLVTEVPSPSETSRAGVKPGDEIVAIDGRRTTTFSADPGSKGELGRIFLNRRWRDKVLLELVAADTQLPYSVRLEAHPDRYSWFR